MTLYDTKGRAMRLTPPRLVWPREHRTTPAPVR
jgi:hypothetical protein